MVYPFEEAAYNTDIGEISKPFRTRFGYHILKVDSLRISQGEVEVAHILINNETKNGKSLIDSIYIRLENDEQFKTLARKYSNDTGSSSKGGKLRKFGKGVMVKPFEDAAFNLEKEGSYSKPFQTRFGWHIVQLIKKYPVQSFEEVKEDLKRKVKSGTRAQLSEKAVIDKLKKKYTISENAKAKAIFNNNEIRNIVKDSLQETILTINDKVIKQEIFVNYIKNIKSKPVYELFQDFKDKEILAYYKDNLEKTEPEFALSGMLKNYDFINDEIMAYFKKRLTQAPDDAKYVLDYALENAKTRQEQEDVCNALIFKTPSALEYVRCFTFFLSRTRIILSRSFCS